MIPRIRYQRIEAAQTALRAALDEMSDMLGVAKVAPECAKYAADREMFAAEALAEQAQIVCAQVKSLPKRGKKTAAPEPAIPDPVIPEPEAAAPVIPQEPDPLKDF